MSLFSRVANLIQIKAQQLLSRVEAPEATVAETYERLLVGLQDTKRRRAEIAAEQRGLDHTIAAGEHAAHEAEAEARTAIMAGDDDAARRALARKQAALATLAPVREARGALDDQAATLADYEALLDERLEQIHLRSQVSQVSRGGPPPHQKAKAEAIDRMLRSGAAPDPLDHRPATERELSTLRASNAVDAEFERLKAETKKPE
jgi:phage shock protein A